jgi:hypothetical protein
MNMTSNILFVIRSLVLLVYFVLLGTEVMAGIILLSWILFTRRAEIAGWVSAKAQSIALPISRVRVEMNLLKHSRNRSVRRDYQTERKLAR